jgi:transposase
MRVGITETRNGYDANPIRAALRYQGTITMIPGRRDHKRPIQHDECRNKNCWPVEVMFCRLKDFRRVAPATKNSTETSYQP